MYTVTQSYHAYGKGPSLSLQHNPVRYGDGYANRHMEKHPKKMDMCFYNAGNGRTQMIQQCK